MGYQGNWDKSKKRFEAFWNREIIDRCCISVTAHKPDLAYEAFPENEEDQIKYWTDGEWILKRNLKRFENTYFDGDSFPQIFLNLGASGHAGFFKKAVYQFKENTVWFFFSHPEMNSQHIEFDPDSFLYKKTIEIARYLTKESKKSFFVSMPDTSGNMDALAHLRGSDALLIDLIDDSEEVKKSLSRIQSAWINIINAVYTIVKDNNDGGSTIGWLNTWAPGLHSQMQCDLSVMISPDTFREFAVPELQEQADFLEYPLYHFDGIEQIRHLDLILSLDKLKAIQWTQVAGQPSVIEYIPVLQKIQSAGKCLMIWVKPEEIEPLLENLSSRGLFLSVNVSTKDEAHEVVKAAERLTHE